MKSWLKKTKYLLKYTLWVLNGYFGRIITIQESQKLTVLITYYNPVRMKYMNHQLRNILKCAFVDKVIVSNHNPDIKIDGMVKVQSNRLTVFNQDVRRACGYRWRIAKDLNTKYLVAIDDDVLLFPWQLKILFEKLILEPEVPHGFSGMLRSKDGIFRYHERENIEVLYLCEIYAVTNEQVQQYFKMEALLAEMDRTLPDAVERLGDFVVISQTGTRNPIIHDAGRLLRSETFKMTGVANHKEEEFAAVLERVSRAVEKIR